MENPVNSYNVSNKNNISTILYHIIAHNEEEALDMLKNKVDNTDDYYIEVERYNVKTITGKPFNISIQSCLIN